MKTNCRNCKWADWDKYEKGRNRFYGFALCNYQMATIATVPITRLREAAQLKNPVQVYERENIDINCQAWAPIKLKF